MGPAHGMDQEDEEEEEEENAEDEPLNSDGPSPKAKMDGAELAHAQTMHEGGGIEKECKEEDEGARDEQAKHDESKTHDKERKTVIQGWWGRRWRGWRFKWQGEQLGKAWSASHSDLAEQKDLGQEGLRGC